MKPKILEVQHNWLGILLWILLIGSTNSLQAQKQAFIFPGAIWPDNRGKHINAHGGGIIKIKDVYYWYGEQREEISEPEYRYVSCYTSKDLINWKFRGTVFKTKTPDTALKNWVLERPKVYYNQKTKKYVMYCHVDGALTGQPGGYSFASVGVAISDKPTGPFSFVRCFRPLGHISRDIGQFIDDDGSAYLIFEDRPSQGFHIARLSDDYLDVKEEVSFIKSPLEGGAIVNYKGLYYAIGSELSGWSPNPNKYATAKSLYGPWSAFKDIAPPEKNTYDSQSTLMLKVTGSKTTSVIFMADQWKPDSHWDSRYLWMPLEIGNGKLWLPEPRPWTINVKTGEVSFINQRRDSK
jgi:hypothetical protein